MRKVIDPGNEKEEIVLFDNIVYSVRKDLEGNPIKLKMSIMQQREGMELKLATGMETEVRKSIHPVLLWIPGGGWRGADKNQMLGEMVQFVNAGYIVASMYYRSSAQGKFPDQIEDVKTAIRFLRANAEKYSIDPEHIGVFGRSAGGHLATLAAMNKDEWESDEWKEYSSKVQCCCDMFGPLDLVANMEVEEKKFSDPNFRWHKLSDTHGGALVGGDDSTIKARAAIASPINYINSDMCPLMIIHGDSDPIVPIEGNSEAFWKKLEESGLAARAEYYIIKGGGHGSREFWQDSVKDLIISFFDRYLKKEEQ